MTGGLPRGLISIEDNPTLAQEHEEDEEPRLDVATIAKTWRIYSASSSALQGDTGNRLQNLFWRAWSNPDLLRNLHPTTFTNIVHHIGTGRGRVQIPRPSNVRTDLHAHDEDDSTPVPSGPPTATASPVQTNSNLASSSAQPPHARQDSNTSIKSPQSILKKPSVDHSYVEPCAAEAPTFVPHQSQRDSTGSSSSATETLSPTSSERPRMKRQTSGNSKKTSFVANTSARSKARPAVPRRKSSQGTVPQAKDRQKDTSKSPVKSPIKSPLKPSSGNEGFPQLPTNRAQTMGPPGLPPPPGLSGAKSPVFLLPSASSWQSVESTSPGRSNPAIQSSMPLVDPNFRKQFVEARSASQLNLAALGSKMRKTGSVVRFAEDLPTEFGKGKAREPSLSGPGESALRRSSGAEARRSFLSAETAAREDSGEEDSEEDTLVMLPRTRSQLSMAIEQQRRISGSSNLGPPEEHAETQSSKSKGKGKGKELENEDMEDELLKMARKDGVTKAGGPRSRLPLRMSPSSVQRYRSPTPPPIF